MIGKRSALPFGTAALRVAVPVTLKTPARYQTGPDCPSPALAPVSSKRGFRSTGIEYAHFHHSADHSPYVLPYGCEPGGKTTTGLPWFAASAGCETSTDPRSKARSKGPNRARDLMKRLLLR